MASALLRGRRRRSTSRGDVLGPRRPECGDRGRRRRTGRGRRRSGRASRDRGRAGPTTRGRTSYGSRPGTARPRSRRKSTPDPPGPPGFVKSTPIGLRRAGRRASAEHDVRPGGVREVERHRQAGALHLVARRPLDRAGSLVPQDDRAVAPGARARRQHRGDEHRGKRSAAHLATLGWAGVPAQRAGRPGVPRRDAVRGRQLARRRRRGAALARLGALDPRDTRATSRTGDGPATSRCARSIVATSRWARAWLRRFTAAEPGYGYVADDVPELSIAVYPEFRRQRVGTLLLGSRHRPRRTRSRARDQPERQHRESGQAHVRALRVRGRRRPRRRIDDAPRASPEPFHPGARRSTSRCPRIGPVGDDGVRTGRMQQCTTSLRNRAVRGVGAAARLRGPALQRGASTRRNPGRAHAPWEFIVLTLFVAILCIGIILGWTLVGAHSPERLDAVVRRGPLGRVRPGAGPVEGAPQLRSAPRRRPGRASLGPKTSCCARWWCRSRRCTAREDTGGRGAGLERRLGSHDRRAQHLRRRPREVGDDEGQGEVHLPGVNAITPITGHMDDFVRENNPHLDACFTARAPDRGGGGPAQLREGDVLTEQARGQGRARSPARGAGWVAPRPSCSRARARASSSPTWSTTAGNATVAAVARPAATRRSCPPTCRRRSDCEAMVAMRHRHLRRAARPLQQRRHLPRRRRRRARHARVDVGTSDGDQPQGRVARMSGRDPRDDRFGRRQHRQRGVVRRARWARPQRRSRTRRAKVACSR